MVPHPRVLITGFGPFPGAPVNPSARMARHLAGSQRLAHLNTESRILPVYWSAQAAFPALLDEIAPDIVLMLGLAARRLHICIETMARNIAGPMPDSQRVHNPLPRLERSGPPARTLAASPMPLLHALLKAGASARLSHDAGRYLCNALAWRAYGWARKRQRENGHRPLAVFIHMPLPRPGRLSATGQRRAMETLLLTLAAQWRRQDQESPG